MSCGVIPKGHKYSPLIGVIIADSLVARQGDGHSYEPSFSSGLHSGTEFLVLEDRGDWWHIRLADGRETWIVAGAGELI